jgi:hypothetical protein
MGETMDEAPRDLTPDPDDLERRALEVLVPTGPVTISRRRSDRWITYLAIFFIVFMCVISMVTSYYQYQADRAHERQSVEIADTRHEMACAAAASEAAQSALIEVVLTQPTTADNREALERLRSVQVDLTAARRTLGPDPCPR